jgi:hypothetical protein
MFLPLVLSILSPTSPRSLLFYVDPSFERVHVLESIRARGAEVLLLRSHAFLRGSTDTSSIEPDFFDVVPPAGSEAVWAKTLPSNSVLCGVLCGVDGGLAEAERLAHALIPTRSNGVLHARRDKFEMNEALRTAGLPVAAQLAPGPGRWPEICAFVRRHGLPVVIKPRRGVASQLVHLVHTEQEAQRVYESMSQNPTCVFTKEADAACGPVVQEFLEGREWIVDTVSRNGEHKVIAVYRYDKGTANGSPFVYFGVEAMGCDAAALALTSYAVRALEGLNWRWGPAHLELMETV